MDDGGNFPREESEASDDEPEADEGQRRPRICEKRTFVCEGVRRSYFAHIVKRGFRFQGRAPASTTGARDSCRRGRSAHHIRRQFGILHARTYSDHGRVRFTNRAEPSWACGGTSPPCRRDGSSLQNVHWSDAYVGVNNGASREPWSAAQGNGFLCIPDDSRVFVAYVNPASETLSIQLTTPIQHPCTR